MNDHNKFKTFKIYLPLMFSSSMMAKEFLCSELSESWVESLDFNSDAIVSGSVVGLNFISSEDDELYIRYSIGNTL